jgi:hypothetical protein
MSKTTAEKLQIKPGMTVWVSHPERAELLGPLPDGVEAVDRPGDVAVVFAEDAASLRAWLAEHAAELATPSVLWVAYPKGGRADVNRDTLWPILGEHDMRPISQISLGDVWSALRFRPLAPGETFNP